jgi:hypothetical protein
MPTHIRAQIAWQVGTMLPRDAMQITPHFRHQNVLPLDSVDWQSLADDLANGLANVGNAGVDKQVTVKLYDVAGTTPNRPRATKILYPGASAEPTLPRELALCLSFYGGPNAPKNRGRIYVPYWLVAASGTTGVRPTATERANAAEFVPLFAGLGGVNVDWIVWSPTTDSATKVENWWVDDEWDVQRRRGYRPTTRLAGTTGG